MLTLDVRALQRHFLSRFSIWLRGIEHWITVASL